MINHPWQFWVVSLIAMVAVVGGIAATGMFCVGLILTWFSKAKERQRGFEVKLTPGTTPGLLEKKEE